jgi:hypothetical protein
VITIYSPTNGIVRTKAMQQDQCKTVLPQRVSLTLGDYIKKDEVVLS